MKIKDVIQEGLYDTISKVGAAKKAGTKSSSDIPFPEVVKGTPEYNQKKAAQSAAQDKADAEAELFQNQVTKTVLPSGKPAFLYKKNYIAKDIIPGSKTLGQWVWMANGQPLNPQLAAELDAIANPAKPKPTPTPAPKAPRGNVQPITATDNAGVIWTKDEDNNAWRNDDGTVAQDPADVKELERRATVAYQNRQMGA